MGDAPVKPWKRPWYDFWSSNPDLDREEEELLEDLAKRAENGFSSGDAVDKFFGTLSQGFKEEFEHKRDMVREQRKAEILPLKAQNAYYETVIKGAVSNVDLEIETGRIQNARLKEEVNAIITNNRISELQAKLLHRVVLELNFEAIEPLQAFDLVRQIVAKVKDDQDIVLAEKRALEDLERAKAETRKAHAQARRDEAQADIEEFVRDETVKR